VRFEDGDSSPRLVEIPIREDLTAEPAERFTVSLSDPRCARLRARRSAAVTILDDDAPPPAPAPAFTIGGTVDGLQGSGLVLSNLGAELAVSGNGSFAFPGTASDGQTYEVGVRTQPPGQVCSVDRGSGHVNSANVTDIAVHCAATAMPSGLDATFGSGGRVSTAVGEIGQGEAVVIQPSGAIVTAGSRAPGTASDFALTRHNPDGTLDPSFGTNGIAVTDLGGAGDQAFDAALRADGGIVAVGRTDAGGVQKTDFGVVRYRSDGTLDAAFGAGGIVRTDILGQGDQANAVAVQPDGKIVVAGFASAAGAHSDFALARYNPDGTLDSGFGDHGIATADFGAVSDDDARALAIQPDGRIVVAGNADQRIALARFMPNGSLDPAFGSLGRTTSDVGSVAKGVAITPGGEILIAGSALGARGNRDVLLAGFRADGSPDVGFGHLGSVTTDLGGGDDFAENLTVDDQGRIVLVGRAGSPTIFDMALVRYQSDGILDTSFAGGGILTADFHGRGEFGQNLALDASGRIVAAGYTANGAAIEFALMRARP
jgi:uncharacterized delta-60 repeat protein